MKLKTHTEPRRTSTARGFTILELPAVRRRESRAFTLIELLSVIAIILILAGLLLPVLSRVHSHAKKVAAKAEIKQIETAWNQYFAEYQKWPSNFTETACAITNEVLWILQGSNIGNSNPKSMSFMHFTRYDTTGGNPLSPWGSKTAPSPATDYYYCKFDVNYDETILTDTAPPVSVRRSVVVWTFNQDAHTNDTDYVIGSWQE